MFIFRDTMENRKPGNRPGTTHLLVLLGVYRNAGPPGAGRDVKPSPLMPTHCKVRLGLYTGLCKAEAETTMPTEPGWARTECSVPWGQRVQARAFQGGRHRRYF